ncbi:MAG: hypothetical protein ACKVUS_21395 [Saprospiraceae bacterium]
MKRTFSHGALCLFLFLPAIAWAQDRSSQPTQISLQVSDSQTSSQIQSSESADSTSTLGFATEVSQSAPMFPDSLMQNYEVETFQGVLKMADLIGFKYNDVLAKAKTGDIDAIWQLLDFHRIVDGKDAQNHAVTCLEIIPLAGDMPFAAAVLQCSPKLKAAVLERTVLAQSRTKKGFLRQSMANWAPFTWASLNGQTLEIEGENSAPATAPDANSTKKQ